MRIAFTCNGPGEWSGWARPLLRELYARDAHAEVHVFFVPDDYASGREADVARASYPALHVHPPREYLALALGRRIAGIPDRFDRVHYMGGDLMHAARIHARLGGIATAYKFSRARYRNTFARVFAVDERNRTQLIGWKTPPERIEIVGNLAIDGALAEAAGAYAANDAHDPREVARDGILLMPGSRRREVAGLFPFFVSVARVLRRRSPQTRVAFAVSPFVGDDELDAALRAGGPERVYGMRARFDARAAEIVTLEGDERFAVVRGGMRAAATAGVCVTIPGTKTIELAALGVPTLVCMPFNVPEDIVMNGPLQYINKIPWIGVPLKRSAVMTVANRFRFYSQPNMDIDEMVQPEIASTLFPARVAAAALAYLADEGARARASARLREFYAPHAGAAGRLAERLLAA